MLVILTQEPFQITICAQDKLNRDLLKENGFGGFADLFAGVKARIWLQHN